MGNNQKKHQFIIMQMIPLSQSAAETIVEMREKLSRISPLTKVPPFGLHINITPRFYSTKLEAGHLATGLKIVNDVYENDSRINRGSSIRCGSIVNMKFLESIYCDFLVLSLDFGKLHGKFLDIYRSNLINFVDLVNTRVRDAPFIPQVQILMGQNLCREVSNSQEYKESYQKLFHDNPNPRSLLFNLEFPKIMIEVGEGEEAKWELFIPSKYKE